MFVRSGDCQADRYILKGGGPEEWEPRFTYHGFRYVQVTGFPGAPTLDDLAARVVHTDFATHGEFSCSNELLNAIQSCARWSTLTNYHGIPMDCPHREKTGWTGDGLLSTEQTLLNFDPMTAYAKWMQDMRDCQTSYACALYQGLADRERAPECVEQLVRCVEEAGRHNHPPESGRRSEMGQRLAPESVRPSNLVFTTVCERYAVWYPLDMHARPMKALGCPYFALCRQTPRTHKFCRGARSSRDLMKSLATKRLSLSS